ncbi:hypothetical protein [Rhodococcoides kyotonense]|uniref:hypothetical protein n=1 Tax=Rhodococcoides kyotonense TaxID=398843 RepID=UPI0012EE4FAC|nr:hypothetical protein [Rhodococcus kyotonensis]
MVDDNAEIAFSWSRIAEVLERNGVDVDTIADDQDASVLHDWYSPQSLNVPAVNFWFSNECWRYATLLPSTQTLGPTRSVDISRLWVEVEEGSPYETEPSDSNQADEAGGWADTYDRRLVPIADQDGVTLVIDTRPGLMQGCVSEYTGAFVDKSSVRWGSARELFADLQSALTGNCLFAGRYRPVFADGALSWQS